MPESAAASLEARLLNEDELLPIREVSRLTGVNPVTLRAWERRYGLIQPVRTESGHRLYSRADVETVQTVLAWIDRGVAVSKVGSILQRSAAAREAAPQLHEAGSAGELLQWQQRISQALGRFDEPELERLYGQVFSAYPLSVVFQDVFMPVWRAFLLRQNAPGGGAQWLMLDAFLRGRSQQRLYVSRSDLAAHDVLVAAMPGQCRELELLVAALQLAGEGIAVRTLGPGLSLPELALVCERTRPQALVLFSNLPPGESLPAQLSRLALSLDCPLLLAGEGADLLDEGLAGSIIARLGSEGRSMQRRLQQFLAGHMDT